LTKLAYPIKKKSTGFYHFFEFQANPEFIANLETVYRRDERILRFLNTKLDKHGVLFNERKQKGEIAPAPKIVKEDAKV
jgi:small subunit ribosomal protein S6